MLNSVLNITGARVILTEWINDGWIFYVIIFYVIKYLQPVLVFDRLDELTTMKRLGKTGDYWWRFNIS